MDDESQKVTRSIKAAKKKSSSFGLKSRAYSKTYQKTQPDDKKNEGYINYDQEV